MTNNVFLRLIRDVLKAGFAEQGIGEVRIMQNFQSKKTTTPVVPAVIVHRIGDRPAGWQSRKVAKLAENSFKNVTTIETQPWITTFQINVLVPRVEPEKESINDLSSDDLLRLTRMLLQGQRMLDACKKAEFGVLPASQIQPNLVQDEHDNWINEPSFNLEITTVQRLEWVVDRAFAGNVRIERV